MKATSANISGLKIVQSKIYRDNRGLLKEVFKQKLFKNDDFIFNIVSSSKKNVIRGFHIQTKFKQAKYVSVLKGAILDIALDLRKRSKTFGKHFKVMLSADNNKSVFLPAGFAHGFLALEKENIVNYNITNYRSAKHEVSLVWNDKDLKIKWPIKNPIISKKDKTALTFYEYKKLYTKNN
jgi:dTDP-4-dehydrorhamnose 3,5-epimerase